MKKAKKTVKDVGWGPMIATPLPEKPKPIKPLSPEMGERMLKSLGWLHNSVDADRLFAGLITLPSQRWRLGRARRLRFPLVGAW
jgi:hypothetical protein